jgi:hypothetical protein
MMLKTVKTPRWNFSGLRINQSGTTKAFDTRITRFKMSYSVTGIRMLVIIFEFPHLGTTTEHEYRGLISTYIAGGSCKSRLIDKVNWETCGRDLVNLVSYSARVSRCCHSEHRLKQAAECVCVGYSSKKDTQSYDAQRKSCCALICTPLSPCDLLFPQEKFSLCIEQSISSFGLEKFLQLRMFYLENCCTVIFFFLILYDRNGEI